MQITSAQWHWRMKMMGEILLERSRGKERRQYAWFITCDSFAIIHPISLAICSLSMSLLLTGYVPGCTYPWRKRTDLKPLSKWHDRKSTRTICVSRNPLGFDDWKLSSYGPRMRLDILGVQQTSPLQMPVSIQWCASFDARGCLDQDLATCWMRMTEDQSIRGRTSGVRLRLRTLVRTPRPRRDRAWY